MALKFLSDCFGKIRKEAVEQLTNKSKKNVLFSYAVLFLNNRLHLNLSAFISYADE